MIPADKIDITVLMPVYNAGQYIAEAIQSVLDQTYSNFELLIINDGSTDDVEDIVRRFADNRIVLVNIEHGGVSKALNTGLGIARGRYIARFDADDICFPHRLEKQLLFLEQHPDHVMTGSDVIYIMEDGEHLFNFSSPAYKDADIRNYLFVYCPFIHSSVMYRKEVVLEAGGYSIYAHSFEDYLLWVQIAGMGRLHNIPEALVKVRFNPGSITIDEKWRGKYFRNLKRDIIRRGKITEQEGDQIKAILTSQDRKPVKEGAYHALCGKKFLANNYQPVKARRNIVKAIQSKPLRWDNYALYILSFFPENFINWLYRRSLNK